jgi:membrane-bound serine protease (ClpP class)
MEVLISDPFFSFLFVGAGLLFLFLEVFVPSGGILGLLSMGCTAFGIYGLFAQGRTFLGAVAIAGSAAVTAAGIRFGLRRLSFSGSLPPESCTSVDQRIESLLGKEGITHTPLRPAGTAIIDGKKVDVVTQGQFIAPNVKVRVVDTTGNWVVVREVSPEKKETPSDSNTNPTA